VCVSVRIKIQLTSIHPYVLSREKLKFGQKKQNPKSIPCFLQPTWVLNKFMGPPMQWITQSKWTSPWLHRANNKFSFSWGCAQGTVMLIFFFDETLSLSHSFMSCCPHISTYLTTWRQKNLNSPLNLKNWQWRKDWERYMYFLVYIYNSYNLVFVRLP